MSSERWLIEQQGEINAELALLEQVLP